MENEQRSAKHVHRRIVLCADDFGMNAAVNAGILDLAARGRLSATSLLVDGPQARHDLPALLASGLAIGLHLNLTESFGQAGLCLPLRPLIVQAYLRRLPRSVLHVTVQRQLERFTALTGRVPDYIDGHQHVHQLPGVRDALLAVLRTLPGPRPWLRHTGCPRQAGLPAAQRVKARIIAMLGARGLQRAARQSGFVQNNGFLGVYDFTGASAAYGRALEQWLGQAQAGDVLMCHPALGGDASDPLSAQRQAEHQVLADPQTGTWLARYALEPVGAPDAPL